MTNITKDCIRDIVSRETIIVSGHDDEVMVTCCVCGNRYMELASMLPVLELLAIAPLCIECDPCADVPACTGVNVPLSSITNLNKRRSGGGGNDE